MQIMEVEFKQFSRAFFCQTLVQLQGVKRPGFGNLKSNNEFNCTLTHWRRIFHRNVDKCGAITENGALSWLSK